MISKLSEVPPRPGVYLFKGQRERVIYVGKAKNLRSRLRSYFQDSAHLDPRKAGMVKTVRDFSFVVTDTELEALILEANLIKQHKPRFNIVLRDDKNYPYLKLTVGEEWPRIEVVRRISNDGSIYFGPYVPAQAMWEALAFIRRNFSIRTCGYMLDKPRRPCVQFQMKRCAAPCAGSVSREEYMRVVEHVRLFLGGEKRELVGRLEEKMERLADEMQFEEAAKVRDRIAQLRRAFDSQKVVAPELGDLDVIGSCRERGEVGEGIAVQVLFVRNGILIGTKDFYLEKTVETGHSEVLHGFIEVFYAKEIIPPPVIAVNVVPDDAASLVAWLRKKRGGEVAIEVPGEGKMRELLLMANENARLRAQSRRRMPEEKVLDELRVRLKLAVVPRSIGAFDVSTIQGSESVGAFVFWEGGVFKKDLYRHLKVRTVEGVDDYAMMREIVGRTVRNLGENMPGLLIIDGGKGQVEAAWKATEDLTTAPSLVGIAKKPDRAFLQDGTFVDLEDRTPSSLLLKRIRDEVHRFAIGFHRKLRDKRLMVSALEEIPGVGKKRRLQLLRYFGSLEGIRKASVDEIAKVKGLNRKIAEMIIERVKKDEKD
jgi:excinuclease ABC subunit C